MATKKTKKLALIEKTHARMNRPAETVPEIPKVSRAELDSFLPGGLETIVGTIAAMGGADIAEDDPFLLALRDRSVPVIFSVIAGSFRLAFSFE